MYVNSLRPDVSIGISISISISIGEAVSVGIRISNVSAELVYRLVCTTYSTPNF